VTEMKYFSFEDYKFLLASF